METKENYPSNMVLCKDLEVLFFSAENQNVDVTTFYIVLSETLYHRDDALLYIAYVMLIWAAPIPADRWHCSLWP